MRKLLALLIASCAAGVCAQEPAQRPNNFPTPARLLAAEAELPSGKPVDFEKAARGLRSANPLTRKAAIRALGSQDNVRAVPLLGEILLKLGEPVDVRAAAATALGRVRNWRAAGFLKQALRDSEREVRFASALALGKTKAPGTLPLLAGTLGNDSDWWVRFAAAVALGKDKDPRSVDALGAAADLDGEWQVRAQAVRSLGEIGSRDAALALGRVLKDKDGAVRAAAATELGGISGLDSINLLAASLHDETDEAAREAMTQSLKKLLAKP